MRTRSPRAPRAQCAPKDCESAALSRQHVRGAALRADSEAQTAIRSSGPQSRCAGERETTAPQPPLIGGTAGDPATGDELWNAPHACRRHLDRRP
jgi:hypothetical protein